MKQICESCGKTIEKPEVAFRLKVELFADPTPPEFTEEDLRQDAVAEMREIIEQLEALGAGEAEDEVYEAYLFTLCGACRMKIHRDLKERQLPFDEHIRENDRDDEDLIGGDTE
ncbi:MAG: hypothetical protein ACOC29_04050 [Candidatus Sumerlaeota bacterium]